MLKNTESKKTNLCYSQFINFQVNSHSEQEYEDFQTIFRERLSPFFLPQLTDKEEVHFTISLLRQVQKFNISRAEKIDFFVAKQDNIIQDFSSGWMYRHNQGRTIYNPLSGTVFEVCGKHVTIIYSDQHTLVRDLQRVIKQLIVTYVENIGGFLLHASAVCYKNIGVAFIGAKGMGKTTCLLESMKDEHSQYITNDRLPIVRIEGEFYALPWFEELRVIRKLSDREKQVIPPTSLFQPTQIQTKPIKLRYLFFPNTTGRDLVDTDSILAEQCLSPEDPQRPKWLGLSTPVKSDALSGFLSSVKFVEIHWQYAERDKLKQYIMEYVSNV